MAKKLCSPPMGIHSQAEESHDELEPLETLTFLAPVGAL